MKFGDYSPPACPSLDQQRDALRKGLGRALQWALNGRLEDEALLEACLRDQRFDHQVEASREDWLWRMIQAVDERDRFRVPILHALYALSDEGNANQLCGFARFYAETGDDTFRSRLYEIVEKKPFPQIPWLGEEEIIALDGEQAFVFAAGVRGRSLASREWDWDDGNLIDLAAERFGVDHVSTLLEGSTDTSVRRFRDGCQQARKAEGEKRQSHKERMSAISVGEIVRAAEGESRCFWFRGWGMHADAASIEGVLRHLWAAREPRAIANLLNVFSARALPKFDARLIEFCRYEDDDVRRRALSALEPNAHSIVREFAEAELSSGVRDGSVVSLFINNYRAGDEERILVAMELPADECELHWLLMDVIKVLEKNPEADCSRLGVIAYSLTPCEKCRCHAARLLHQRHSAPEWLKQESRYDSAKECRELVGKDTGST